MWPEITAFILVTNLNYFDKQMIKPREHMAAVIIE